MKKKIFIVAAVLAVSQVQAQNSNKTMDTVIVTANKFPQKQDQSGKVLTVITQEQLQKSYARTIGQVLNQQVGVTVNGANNNLGTNQALYIRGANYANALILIDGIPQYDASGISNEFDLNTFPIDQIERIEILKGAQSTLYGSDAVAGVINIITKKSFNKPSSVNINLTAGSFNTYKANISVSGSDDGILDYYVGYSKVHSEGFSSAYDSTGKGDFDKDGFDQDVLQGSLGFAATSKLYTRVYGKFSYHRGDIDAGAFTDDRDYGYDNLNANLGFSAKYQLAKAALHLNYNYNWYNREFLDDSRHVGGFSTYQEASYMGRSKLLELFSTIKLSKNLELVAGTDYRKNGTDQSYYSESMFGPYATMPLNEDSTNTNQFSVYASLLYKNTKGFNAEIGGRWNKHSIYGSNATFSFSPSYKIGEHVKVFGSIASAYKVPSLYQLYSDYGNKDLKPESSLNYEAGMQYNKKNFTARVLGFKRDIKDVFIFYTDLTTYASFYKNEDRQKDYGIEAEASLTVNKLTLSANYTYVDGKVHTKDAVAKDTSYFNLYRRPKNTINFTAELAISKKASVSAHVRSVGKFYEAKYNDKPYEMDGYYTIDLYGGYTISKCSKIFVDLQNITDKVYFDQRGFNSRKFSWNAGISINL